MPLEIRWRTPANFYVQIDCTFDSSVGNRSTNIISYTYIRSFQSKHFILRQNINNSNINCLRVSSVHISGQNFSRSNQNLKKKLQKSIEIVKSIAGRASVSLANFLSNKINNYILPVGVNLSMESRSSDTGGGP